MGLIMGLLGPHELPLDSSNWAFSGSTVSSPEEEQRNIFHRAPPPLNRSSFASSNSKGRTVEEIMDPAEMRYLEEEDGPLMKTIKGSITGFGAGTIYGTILATWKDVPRVERNVALPGLIRTLKMMGTHGLTFAAIGGVYIGVEQLVQNFRSKRDFYNGAIGGFVAGASVLGYRARSIPTAIAAGATLAVTSALIDSGGQTTRVDTGREYYPYTVEKRAEADS